MNFRNTWKKPVYLLLLLLLSISCRNEDYENEIRSGKNGYLVNKLEAKNGRLYFPNKESFGYVYQELKSKKIEEVGNIINKTGVESLIPIITDKNEYDVISKLNSRKIEYLKTSSAMMRYTNPPNTDIYDDVDDIEEVIGDDVYNSILNGDAEVQIANKIYKYTDVGLFVTEVDNYTNLQEYLSVRSISLNLLVETETSVRDNFISSTPNDILSTLPNTDNKINYFRSISYNRSGPNGPITVPSTPQDPNTSIASIIQNLPIGTVKKPLVGNIFGKTWVTYDKYENNRRVKVKFYSQNVYLVYAIGCKVKHQYKGLFGLWRKENADKLGIGVNSIKWVFNHPFNTTTSSAAGVPKELYILGSNAYSSSDGITFTFSQTQNIPSLPFANKLDGIIQFSLDFSGLTEDQLNKLFWETAWKQANKLLENQNKKLNRVAFVVDSFNATYVQYFDFSQIEDNQDVLERIFDAGGATPKVTYVFGGGTGNGLSLTSYKWDFSKPDAVAVNMYGIALKNGAWHGVKLIIQ